MDKKTPVEKLKEEVDKTINLAYHYVSSGINLIENLAKSFHQRPDDKAWEELADLFEGIDWLLRTMTQIDSIEGLGETISDYKTWNEYVKVVKELMEVIKEMEEALKAENNIVIGNILENEIVAIFGEMETKLEILKARVKN